MGRLDTRIERLEAAAPRTDGSPHAVVRYNPGTRTGWLPEMFASLGWLTGLVATVTIDGHGEEGVAPEVVVPPVSSDRLTSAQNAILAHAGSCPGRWWMAISSRGWADAMPMFDGEVALLANLRQQRDRAKWGHGGDL